MFDDLKGKDGPVYDTANHVEELLALYRESNPNKFRYITVEGGHHVHLTNPERVLDVIEEFLKL